jgi:hypothetical protein
MELYSQSILLWVVVAITIIIGVSSYFLFTDLAKINKELNSIKNNKVNIEEFNKIKKQIKELKTNIEDVSSNSNVSDDDEESNFCDNEIEKNMWENLINGSISSQVKELLEHNNDDLKLNSSSSSSSQELKNKDTKVINLNPFSSYQGYQGNVTDFKLKEQMIKSNKDSLNSLQEDPFSLENVSENGTDFGLKEDSIECNASDSEYILKEENPENNCQEILKSGKNKGSVCNKKIIKGLDKCKNHCK